MTNRTLLQPGTRSCRTFILSLIFSLLACPTRSFSQKNFFEGLFVIIDTAINSKHRATIMVQGSVLVTGTLKSLSLQLGTSKII